MSKLWQSVGKLGWLPEAPSRIVIQVGQSFRSALVVETARCLADFLSDRVPGGVIEVVDPAASSSEWERFRLRDSAIDCTLTLSGIAVPEGLAVPKLWFESFFLITVSAAHPDRAAQLACVLHAQAEPLRRLGNCSTPQELIYEAHRLAPSDLSIACGYARFDESASERWWAVSLSDIAVDQAVASAAGVDPARLPMLRALTRHERITSPAELVGTLPRLDGYLAPAWKAHASAARSGISASQRAVVHDLIMVRRNLHKIPGFIRRRLAARRRGAA